MGLCPGSTGTPKSPSQHPGERRGQSLGTLPAFAAPEMALQCSFGKHPGVRQLGGETRGWLVAAKILLGPWVPGLCLPWGAAERSQHRWHTRAGTFGASCSPQRGAGQLKVSEHSSLVSVLPSLGQSVKGAAVLCSGGPCVNGASPWGAFPGPLGRGGCAVVEPGDSSAWQCCCVPGFIFCLCFPIS